MKKSGTLAARTDLWNRIGEEVYVYLTDPRCDYRVWDDAPRDLRLVKYSGPVEVIQPFEDKCLALGASLYQGFIPLSATGMDADGDDPMDPDIPGKTIGEAWDEEASKHWVRDSVAILIAVVVGAAVFLAVGFAVNRADAETRAAGYSAEKPMEAEDLAMDAGKTFAAEIGDLMKGRLDEPEKAASREANEGVRPEEPPVQDEQDQEAEDAQLALASYYGGGDGDGEELPVYSEGRTGDFASDGRVKDESGTVYTWYSQKALPGEGLSELNANGRHVGEDSFIHDGDGYFAIAVPKSLEGDYPVGTEIETPWGTAKVYDSNEGNSWDLYTDF